jgi:hypothetical protein
MSTCNSYLMTSKSILLLRYQVLYLSTTIIYPPYSTVLHHVIDIYISRLDSIGRIKCRSGGGGDGGEWWWSGKVKGAGRGGGGIGSVSWVVPTCALVDLRVGVGGRAGVTSVTRLVP